MITGNAGGSSLPGGGKEGGEPSDAPPRVISMSHRCEGVLLAWGDAGRSGIALTAGGHGADGALLGLGGRGESDGGARLRLTSCAPAAALRLGASVCACPQVVPLKLALKQLELKLSDVSPLVPVDASVYPQQAHGRLEMDQGAVAGISARARSLHARAGCTACTLNKLGGVCPLVLP